MELAPSVGSSKASAALNFDGMEITVGRMQSLCNFKSQNIEETCYSSRYIEDTPILIELMKRCLALAASLPGTCIPVTIS